MPRIGILYGIIKESNPIFGFGAPPMIFAASLSGLLKERPIDALLDFFGLYTLVLFLELCSSKLRKAAKCEQQRRAFSSPANLKSMKV